MIYVGAATERLTGWLLDKLLGDLQINQVEGASQLTCMFYEYIGDLGDTRIPYLVLTRDCFQYLQEVLASIYND